MINTEQIQRVTSAVYARAVNGDAGSGIYVAPTSRLQNIGFFILFFFPAVAFVVWLLRLYGRFSLKQFGWDDVLISMAMSFSIAETAVSYKAMKTMHVGIRFKDIPPQTDFVAAQKWVYFVQILYNPILALVKTSVLLFLLRLGGQKRSVRFTIYSLLAFNVALMLGIFISCILSCRPIPYFWLRASPNPPEGSCFDTDAFVASTAALTLLTDVLVLALPFWIFLGLKLPLKVRMAIIGVFTLGGVVTIFGILRLHWLVQTSYFPKIGGDPTYDIRFCYSAVETNLAIITASAPALRPLFVKWFPKFFSTFRSSAKKYTDDRYAQSGDKRSRSNLTGNKSGHHSGAFPLKELKGARTEIRSHSPTNSEEEIMTYNGIIKTSEVAVSYGDQESAHGSRGFDDEHYGEERRSSSKQWP